MKSKLAIRFSLSSMLLATALIALVLAAFCRGNYLLGIDMGIGYAIVAVGLGLLARRALNGSSKPGLTIAILALLALPIGFILAFPASINPDIQHFINKQATDRSVRAELKHVFQSDPAFSDLSISTTHLKVVNVTIYGALQTRDEMQRLRDQITTDCPTLELCPLHWSIRLRDTNEHVDGLDRKLFPRADETAEPRDGRERATSSEMEAPPPAASS